MIDKDYERLGELVSKFCTLSVDLGGSEVDIQYMARRKQWSVTGADVIVMGVAGDGLQSTLEKWFLSFNEVFQESYKKAEARMGRLEGLKKIVTGVSEVVSKTPKANANKSPAPTFPSEPA